MDNQATEPPVSPPAPASIYGPVEKGTGPPDVPGRRRWPWRGTGLFLGLREQAPRWQTVIIGFLSVGAILALWWFVTRGDPEERILSPSSGLYSPWETFSSFHSLWFDRGLTRNLLVTLRRVGLGFGLATVIGVPVGILCGCFARVNAFFLPMTLFGRNIPVAALIPLTYSLFGIGELQKMMFIFIAAVAFVISDTARSVGEVREAYIDSAFTLGAGTWQTIMKVLVPLSMPSVFNSLRLLFSLAFGYIMLAEVVKFGSESGGLGDIINTSQRRGPREHVLLVLLIIPIVALMIDYVLVWIQKQLFPYRYGGPGLLHEGVRAVMHGWEDLKNLFWRPARAAVAAEPGPSQAVSQAADRGAS
jgi:NitT/TauT family transport system permease protein